MIPFGFWYSYWLLSRSSYQHFQQSNHLPRMISPRETLPTLDTLSWLHNLTLLWVSVLLLTNFLLDLFELAYAHDLSAHSVNAAPNHSFRMLVQTTPATFSLHLPIAPFFDTLGKTLRETVIGVSYWLPFYTLSSPRNHDIFTSSQSSFACLRSGHAFTPSLERLGISAKLIRDKKYSYSKQVIETLYLIVLLIDPNDLGKMSQDFSDRGSK